MKSNEVGSLLELTKRFKAMEAEIERKMELLILLEWDTSWSPPICPICGNDKYEGHAPDCKLAREIKP